MRVSPRRLETWKKRCEQFAALGSNKILLPQHHESDGQRRGLSKSAFRTLFAEAGDVAKQFNLTGMIEFARSSTLASPR